MTVLRNIEQKIEALFEGVFGRAFRTHVQPVELARKLAKEMDDHRMVSVSRVYAPNEYSVYLSPADREQFDELRGVPAQRAPGVPRRARPPRVLRAPQPPEGAHGHRRGPRSRRVRDRDAHGAAGAGEAPAEPVRRAGPGATMVYRPQAPATAGRDPGELGVEPEVVTLDANGTQHRSTRSSVVIGRSRECDIRLADPNVSRRHAEVRHEGAAYWILDLGSTNGLTVNGRRQQRAKLEQRATASPSARPSLSSAMHDCGLRRRRRGAAPTQGLLSRPPLPLHLANRAHREPRPPSPAGELRARPPQAAAAGSRRSRRLNMGRLVVLKSRRSTRTPSTGSTRAAISIGRGDPNDVRLDGDDFASAQARPGRAPARRRLDRGRRLDERHLRERRAASSGAQARARRPRPRRRDRPEVRA